MIRKRRKRWGDLGVGPSTWKIKRSSKKQNNREEENVRKKKKEEEMGLC